MNRLQTWCATQTKQEDGDSIYANVYGALWFIALLSAFISYLNLPTTDLPGTIGRVCSILFVIATSYQQWAVYRDLHKIEKKPDLAKQEYGHGWVGSKCERVFRYGIIISLLFGVGKIAAVVYPILTSAGKGLGVIGLQWGQCLEKVLGGIFHQERLFIIGSLFTFLFLFGWNTGALWVRLHHQHAGDSQTRMKHFIISCRIVLFTLSIACGLIYWFVVFGRSDWVSIVSMLLIVLYALITAGVFCLRNDRSREWLATRLFTKLAKLL